MGTAGPNASVALAARLLTASLAVVSMVGWQNASPADSQLSGTIAFGRQEARGTRLWTMTANGSRELRLAPKREVDLDRGSIQWLDRGGIHWSPAGKSESPLRLPREASAAERSYKHDELFVINVDGSSVRRLTWTRRASASVFHAHVNWSPNGRRIVFARYDDGPDGIYVRNPNRGRERPLVRRPGHYPTAPTLSPNGRKIAFQDVGGVYVMNADGGRRHKVTEGLDGGVSDLVWSPDGRKIALIGGDVWLMNPNERGCGRSRRNQDPGGSSAPRGRPTGGASRSRSLKIIARTPRSGS